METKMTTKCKKCKNNFENPGYNPNMDLDLCPDCNLEIEEKIEEMNDLTRNVKIEEIFEKLDISGDIAPLEDVEDYWKRKLIEVFGKSKW